MPELIIKVHCQDRSDLDWLQDRCLDAVTRAVDKAHTENLLDDEVNITSDIDFDT
jgi:hypothetical protein